MAVDFLPEEGLTDFQRRLRRALSDLPHRPSEMADLALLRSGLRNVLALLNYELANDHVAGLPDDVEDPRVVAERNGFKVVHLHLPRLRASVERPAVERARRSYPQSLIVCTSRDEMDGGAWHFINVDTGGSRPVIRRAVLEPPFVGRTVLETLSRCQVGVGRTGLEIQMSHEEAFDVREVTKDFYRSYARHFERLCEVVRSTHDMERKAAEDIVQELLNRLLFLSFLQRKDWLGFEQPDRNYLWNAFRKDHMDAPETDSYHTQFLAPLFAALSMRRGASGRRRLEEAVGRVPFLNGGLFEADNDAETPTLKNRDFQLLFEDLLIKYNFTVREDTPLDQEVAVDPEMLGRVFESLVLERERQQDVDLRKATGSYYTPREVVHFLCQQALLRWLAQTAGISAEAVNALREIQAAERLSPEDLQRVEEALTVTQCHDIRSRVMECLTVDPAVGSGAFLVAMLHEMLNVVRITDARVHGPDVLDQRNYDYDLKSHFIQHCLYGVDIQDRAARICELRLWLSLVVDYQGVDVPPLPNLTYRVKCGDSLIEHLFGHPFNLTWAVSSDEGRRLVDEFMTLKEAHALTTEVPEKRRLELRVFEKQCELAELAISEKRATRGARIAMEGFGAEPGLDDSARLSLQELDRLLGEAGALRQRAHQLSSRSRPPSADDVRELRERAGLNFVWRLDFAEVWRRKGGFDIAVANPPYVRIQTLSKEDVVRYRTIFRSATRSYDIYVLFDEATFNLLNPAGVMAFIQANKFLTAEYGAGLRKWITERQALRLLVDFGNVQIFDATIYTCLLFLSPLASETFQYARLDRGGQEDAFRALASWADDDTISQTLPAEQLGEEAWLLDRPEAATVWHKLLSTGRRPLSELVRHIFQGLVTSADPVYIVEPQSQSKGITRAYSKSLETVVDLEASALRPLLKGSDIRRYAVRGPKYAVVWPYDVVRETGTLRPANLFSRNFPRAWRYLKMNEARLRGREKGKMDHDDWYGFVYPKNLEHFERPKILVQVLARRAAMAADPEGRFYFVGGGNAGGYGIVTDDSQGLDPFYLLALLNGRTLDAYLQSYASRFQNDYYSYAKRFIERLPIAIASPAEQEELAAKARELQSLHTEFQSDPKSQTQGRIRDLELEVDRQIYSIYGLSRDDVAVIEERRPPEPELTEEFGRLLSYSDEESGDA
jgi:hypothetical protein